MISAVGMGRVVTGAALVVVVVWPVVATVLLALQGEAGPSTSAGLIDASAFGRETGLVAGPAVETLRVVGFAVLGSFLLGIPLALGLFRTDLPGRVPVLGMMALALFVPMPLYAAAWIGGFGNAGYQQAYGTSPLLVGWTGAAFVHAMAGVPWVVLLAGIGLKGVEPELEESARLDLPLWRVVPGVTLRRSAAAIIGAGLLVAVLTSGDMTITDLLLVRTYAEEAYVQYGLGRPPWAVALVAIPPTLVMMGTLLIALRFTEIFESFRVSTGTRSSQVWLLGRWRWPAAGMVWGVSVAMFGPPLAALIWRAGRIGGDAARGIAPGWSVEGLAESLAYAMAEVRAPLVQTGIVAAIGASLSVVLAWGLSWQLRTRGAWRVGIVTLLALMLAMPGPVAGMALKLAYLHVPIFYDTSLIVILGAMIRTVPFAVLVLWPAVRRVPLAVLESAEVDGWGPWQRVWRVAVPLSLRGIAGAWLVAFVLAMGELPITNLVTPAGMDSLTVFLWGQMHFGVDSRISGVGLVLLGLYAAVGGLTVAVTSATLRSFHNVIS
ncbi:ABC transporter permease [Tautonia rosea]|uniref:ABC transporter permease n=1 Tax=Tautonia rosea TaxID=2728037 RepID=UPI0014730FEE|nr:ABC transporter permease subunit [Tautonia rosea]